MTERERFTKGIYAWVGFKNKWIEYENVERAVGRTTCNIGGLGRYAILDFLRLLQPVEEVIIKSLGVPGRYMVRIYKGRDKI